MMGELVEMHREFVRYYGPDTDGLPKWMEAEKLNELPSVLQKAVTEDRGKDLISLMPLQVRSRVSSKLCIYGFSSCRIIYMLESLIQCTFVLNL